MCLLAGALLAVDFAGLKPQGYVSDFANVIDAQSRQELERYCTALERSTGAELALVTLPSLQGEPVEDVANAMFRAWGVGKKGKNEGILLLLSIGDRRSRFEVGYGLEPIITDGTAGSILREMAPELRDGRYGPAMLVAATEIGSRIARAKNVEIATPTPVRTRVRRAHPANFVPLIFFGVIGGLFLMALIGGSRGGRGGGGGGGVLPWLLLSALNQGGSSRDSGGGFGGYDSGGGFGGFGGGDSGGGGASGSW